jgi:hypothetical protein
VNLKENKSMVVTYIHKESYRKVVFRLKWAEDSDSTELMTYAVAF